MNDGLSRHGDLFKLVSALCDGVATPEEVIAAERYLTDDAEARDIYVEYMAIHSGLRSSRIAHSTWGGFDDEVEASLLDDEEPSWPEIGLTLRTLNDASATKPWLPRREVVLACAAAMVVVGLTISLFAYLRVTPRHDVAGTGRGDGFTATLTGQNQIVWQQDEAQLPFGAARLRVGQKLVMESGVAEITYDTGARVVIEGPAEYMLLGKNSGHLGVGKLVTQLAAKTAQGFLLSTPSVLIEDLGTEFDVEVYGNGDVEVMVLNGQVECLRDSSPSDFGARMSLTGGQGVFVSANGQMTRREHVLPERLAAARKRLSTPVGMVEVAADKAGAARVRVLNPSFEFPYTASDWHITKDGAAERQMSVLTPRPTHGQYNAYTNGPEAAAHRGPAGPSTLQQTLDQVVQDGAVYTLTVDAGQHAKFHGSTGAVRLFGSEGGYESPLANALGTAEVSVAPPSGNYQQITVTYHALTEDDPHAGERIGIAVSCITGIQIIYDNVRMTVTLPNDVDAPPVIDATEGK